MKIAILARKAGLYSHRRLVEAGQKRGHEMRVINTLRCYMNITSLRPEVRYRGGVADYLEVLDAQRSQFSAEMDEVQAITGQLVSLIRLYKALGGGWPTAPESEATAAAGAVPMEQPASRS